MVKRAGKSGNAQAILIVGHKSYIANRLCQHFERDGTEVQFLSQSGNVYCKNNKLLPELLVKKNRNSFKYSHIINCAGPDRDFCIKFPEMGITRRKQVLYKIFKLIEYGLAENIMHLSTIHVFGGVNSKDQNPKSFACPNDPYGYSHVIAENELIEQFSSTKYKNNFTILRLPNLFGHSKKMLAGPLGLFGNETIYMACKGLVKLKAKKNYAINLFPLGLLCDMIVKECIEQKYLGQTINLYPERPTKILDYVNQINKHTQFDIESKILVETPRHSNNISDIQFNNFESYFDYEVYETFLFFQKKCK